jgi:hypothetical protein
LPPIRNPRGVAVSGRHAIITIALPDAADDDASDAEVVAELREELAGLAWRVVDVFVDSGQPTPT